MKKKIVYGIAVLAIAAVAAWNVGLNSRSEFKISNIVLENIEALGQESGGTASCSCTKRCPDGNTVASCTGYDYCDCYGSSSWSYVICDGVRASC